ncbi:relaxase/mobilization nuclease domain-containing protein [Proteiniclasticum sp. C24MP]|uniref:relaxase/mobilization nuclease domain-containing protein n=1 Tax=Proteiniclasticum sp. C24MP TaxID=3374101 RepID=UPI00375496DA
MATIKHGTTRVANRLITYAEKKAEERSGVKCDPNYVRSQFSTTRNLWGKNDEVQAHHVIQSFKPGETTPQQANEIGQKLAEKLAPDHEAVVYTHTDKHHIHNHIIINSVNIEDGKKLHFNARKSIEKMREQSDQLCKSYSLSVVEKPSAKIRYTLAEREVLKKGQISWKKELRSAILAESKTAKTFDDFKNNLQKNHNITVKEGKNDYISYKHPETGKAVSGKKLGLLFEKESIKFSIENRPFERLSKKSSEILDKLNEFREKPYTVSEIKDLYMAKGKAFEVDHSPELQKEFNDLSEIMGDLKRDQLAARSNDSPTLESKSLSKAFEIGD